MAKKTLLDNIIESIKGIDEGLDKQDGSIKQAIADLNYKVVEPAKSAADSAYEMANQAANQADVTQLAQSAVASATAEAVRGADEALGQAKNAWAEAMTATSTASSAQSNAQSAIAKTEALSTNVNVLQGTVTTLQAESTTQADEIKNKVTQSDVTGMLTGYATQEYTQSLVTQKADDWNLNLTKLKNDTQTSVTNLSATVDGIKSTVANYQTDTSSHFTQLSNLIQSKVGTDDFNSLKQTVGLQTLESADIDSMNKNGHYFVHNLTNSPISGWVYVDITGNGIDRIRQDVYQDNGTKHKYRRWVYTSWTGWEEGATYTEINQLQDAINLRVTKGDLISQINLQAGTALIQSNKLVLDGKTTVITGEAFIPSAAISSIQADKIQIGNSQLFSDDGTLNLINQNAGTSSIKLTTGNVQGSTQPVTKFANGYNLSAIDISPVGTVIRPTLFFEDYPGQAKDTGWLGFSRRATAELYFHTYDDTKELFRIACVSRFNQEIHVDKPIWQQGLSIVSGNTIWSGSNFLAIGDHISNSFTNVMARSFSQQSTLSSKTNIETVDPKDALDLVNRTDIRSYQYKTDVEQGKTKRYTSLIIDDVNDVSQYYAPNEFTNEERTGRDDGSAVGFLFLAVKELTRRIKTLEEKLNG